MLRPVGYVLGNNERESMENVSYEEVNPYQEQRERWNTKHANECWILEQHSDKLWWVNQYRVAISPIKTFRSKDKAIMWLDSQGANWLTVEQYDEVSNAKKRTENKNKDSE